MSDQAGTGSLDAAIEVTDALEPGAVLVLPGLRLHDETLDEYARRCHKITGVGTEEGGEMRLAEFIHNAHWEIDDWTYVFADSSQSSSGIRVYWVERAPAEPYSWRPRLQDVMEVVAFHATSAQAGSGSEQEMVAVLRLRGDRWAAVSAGNDFTGWGCHGDYVEWRVATNRADVIRNGLTEEQRRLLGLSVIPSLAVQDMALRLGECGQCAGTGNVAGYGDEPGNCPSCGGTGRVDFPARLAAAPETAARVDQFLANPSPAAVRAAQAAQTELARTLGRMAGTAQHAPDCALVTTYHLTCTCGAFTRRRTPASGEVHGEIVVNQPPQHGRNRPVTGETL